MAENLVVYKVENTKDLRDIAPLQALYDPEFLRNTNPNAKVNGELALENIVDLYKQGHDFWIARLGEEAVGYAKGNSPDNLNYDSAVYVKLELRNKGIDRILMLNQIDFAREKGYLEMWLTVPSDGASRKSLENMGFIVAGGGYPAPYIKSFFLLKSVNLLRTPHT